MSVASARACPNDHHGRAQVREHAVSDVLDGGMSMIGAADLWGRQVADLERWVQAAVAERNADGEGMP